MTQLGLLRVENVNALRQHFGGSLAGKLVVTGKLREDRVLPRKKISSRV